MITITLTSAEFRRIRKLVHTDYVCHSNVARTYKCSPAEKARYVKGAKLAKALDDKLDALITA